MSEEVRAKKMAEDSGVAGNGHTNGHSNGEAKPAEAQAPTAALTDSPPVVPARIEGLDLGPACSQCGGMMQRTGSCYTCSSCGNNTGCG
jgi:ribonucleoside-diphosphate reductase alpha chain